MRYTLHIPVDFIRLPVLLKTCTRRKFALCSDAPPSTWLVAYGPAPYPLQVQAGDSSV